MLGRITNNSINQIKQSIERNESKKNIVVCFSDNEHLLDQVKGELNSLPQ